MNVYCHIYIHYSYNYPATKYGSADAIVRRTSLVTASAYTITKTPLSGSGTTKTKINHIAWYINHLREKGCCAPYENTGSKYARLIGTYTYIQQHTNHNVMLIKITIYKLQ